MGKTNDRKPRGRMSSYAYFVHACREEQRKKHPGGSVVFTDFIKRCADKWKNLSPRGKQRFEEMAKRDKARYDREMANYVPPKRVKRKRTKDPNAPKRALPAFFFYCAEERPKVQASNPGMPIAQIAKELGRRWERLPNHSRFEEMATKDRERYRKEMAAYMKGKFSRAKKAKPGATSNKASSKQEDSDDSDDEYDDDEDDDEDDD
ncbi:high mobility group protein B2-like [Pomacea canaliculata]|uniref:high mobility group protein B2-like n=1 Tax=Pomacea canaliculata TaxID=400727 RepID=UPI000D730F63|nr:high mobility group protein B2-like [Pomacea canaliculata]